MKKKPKWRKPKLLVLVRGKPEEMVCSACKSAGYGAPGGNSGSHGVQQGGCYMNWPACGPCMDPGAS